jgi:hypothetical protein
MKVLRLKLIFLIDYQLQKFAPFVLILYEQIANASKISMT